MIVFLCMICVVSVFGDDTLIAKSEGPAIKIVWTKTEKLEISIPAIGSGKRVETPIDDQQTTPMLSSLNATTTAPGTETQSPAGNTTNVATTTTAWTDSTVWIEESTLEPSSTISDEDFPTEETFSEEPEATTSVSSTNAEENYSRTSENISNEPDLTTSTIATTTTDPSSTIGAKDRTTEETFSEPESRTNVFSTTAEDHSSKTTDNFSNEIETSTTSAISTTTPTAPPCNDTQGKDFIFLIDAAAVKERAKMEELIEAFLNVIRNGHPCDRIALVSYSAWLDEKMVIPLTVGVNNAAVMNALRAINFTEHNVLLTAMDFINYEVLSKPDYRGIALKHAGKERIVVIVATAEGSAGEDLNGQKDVQMMCYVRAHIIDQYGAQILLVTIGQPRFPVFQFVAPDDETVKIESFENFSPSTAVNEFCCRFSLCEAKETEMCARVKAREIEKKIVYPKCEELPARATDSVLLIDRAGMNHKREVMSLAESFINLIDPWKTANRLHIGSYANGSDTLSFSSIPAYSGAKIDTKEVMLDKIGKIEYQRGSDVARAISHSSIGFGTDDWQNRSRQRVMIIIAGAVPSVETGGMEGCSKYHRNFLGCAQERVADRRSTITGMYGAKMFLITIGDLPTEILKEVAPENEIVKIDSGEKFSIGPVIQEFKRRFCM